MLYCQDPIFRADASFTEPLGLYGCWELKIDTFIGEHLPAAGSSPPKIMSSLRRSTTVSDWLIQNIKAQTCCPNSGQFWKATQLQNFLYEQLRSQLQWNHRSASPCGLFLPSLFPDRRISCKHFLINLLHAILHLRFHFRGTQTKTKTMMYDNDTQVPRTILNLGARTTNMDMMLSVW